MQTVTLTATSVQFSFHFSRQLHSPAAHCRALCALGSLSSSAAQSVGCGLPGRTGEKGGKAQTHGPGPELGTNEGSQQDTSSAPRASAREKEHRPGRGVGSGSHRTALGASNGLHWGSLGWCRGRQVLKCPGCQPEMGNVPQGSELQKRTVCYPRCTRA